MRSSSDQLPEHMQPRATTRRQHSVGTSLTSVLLGGCSLAGLLLATATPAFAQTADAPAPPEAAAPAQPSDSEGLQDIVVTAQKRSESAQTVPISITAVSGATLAQSGIKDIFQAVDLVPGVILSRAPDDGLGLTFRGLGAAARPQAFEQSVAMFSDGVFFGKGRLYSTTLFDVDRVEFIKGTQSTLLGKNASVGAISIVNRQPGKELSFDGSAGYEAVYGGYQLDAAADLPASDTFTTRIAVHYNDLRGTVRNIVTGRDVPEDRDLGIRATARWDATDRLKLTGIYSYIDTHRIGSDTQLTGPDVPAAYGGGALDNIQAAFTSRTGDGESQHRIRSHIASLKLEWQLGSYELIAQSSYVAYRLMFDDDFDFNKDPYTDFLRSERYRQFTQEVRLQSDAARPFSYIGGFFYMSSHWNSSEAQLWGIPGIPPVIGGVGQLFNGPFTDNFVQDTKTYSGFASAKWNITDVLVLSGGVRFTRETKDVLFGRTNAPPFTIWNTIANPPFDPTPLRHNASFWDGNVNLEYKIAPSVRVYAAFGHGSKSGGFVETNSVAVPPFLLVNGKVPPALVAAGSAIMDEFTKSYEVGLKSELFDRRLRFNVAVFKTDIRNFQDSFFTGGPLGFITDNNPATSKGVELQTAFAATKRLRLDASFTYADATEVSQPVDANGNLVFNANGSPTFNRYRRAQAPLATVEAGIDYKVDLTAGLDADFGARLHHRSSMFNQRQEQFLSEPLTTADLSAGLSPPDGRWSVNVVARNLNNQQAAQFGGPSPDPRFRKVEAPNASRTVLITVGVHF